MKWWWGPDLAIELPALSKTQHWAVLGTAGTSSGGTCRNQSCSLLETVQLSQIPVKMFRTCHNRSDCLCSQSGWGLWPLRAQIPGSDPTRIQHGQTKSPSQFSFCGSFRAIWSLLKMAGWLTVLVILLIKDWLFLFEAFKARVNFQGCNPSQLGCSAPFS